MKKTLWGIILSVLISCDVSFGLYYTIVGQNSARVDSPYQAYLASANYDNPTNLEVVFQCGDDVQTAGLIELHSASNELLEFTIPKDDSLKSCKMTAKSSDGIQYEKVVKILKKTFSILIETDRPRYTVGDDVKYRVVVLDAELKPYKFGSLDVVIGDGVELKQQENFKFTPSEFYEGSFKIPDDARHGKWKITVYVDGNQKQKKRHTFTVAEYNLPSFQVKVETSANVLLVNRKISVKIIAEKILGNGKILLSGTATVTATVLGADGKTAISQGKTQHLQVQGDNSEVTFDLQRDLRINSKFPDSIVKLDVVFEDSMTRRTEFASTDLKVHINETFIIENNSKNEFITPGESYTFEVLMKKFNGEVEKNGEVVIQLYNIFHSGCLKKTLKRTPVTSTTRNLSNGIAKYHFKVPENSNGMTIRVIYGRTRKFFKLWRVPTKSRENIKVDIQTENLSIEQDVIVAVKATHPMEDLHALVVGRSGILYHEMLKIAEDTVTMNFKFTALPSMAPTSSLIVFYIHPSGEIIFDLAPLEFDSLLPNFLNISVSAETSSPGSEITFSIETAANSFVALSAIDQRSLLFGSSSQINMENVKQEVNSFYSKESKRNFTGKQDAYILLDGAKAFFLTDANEGEPPCTPERFGKENEGEDYNENDDDEGTDHIVPYVQTNSEANYETWIFEKFQADSEGRISFSKNLPKPFTSYTISGFSLSQQIGLGLVTPTKLGNSNKFFVEVDVPKTLLVGEVVKVFVYVYNLMGNARNKLTAVEMKQNEGFELVNATETGGACKYSKAIQNSKTAIRSSNSDVVSVADFYVKALKKGSLKLEVIATSNGATDRTSKTISVSKRTLKRGKNVVKFFDLREFRYDSYYFEPEIDENAEPGSMQSEVYIDRNPMGPALTNVNGLIKNLPTVSTEQKLSKFMPAALFIRYLNAVGGFKEIDLNEARKILEDGYNYVVSQKITEDRKSGAFRNWNGDDITEIIEVTARVLKFLSVAKDWMETEEQHILDALNFLKQNAKKGKFFELNADGSPTPSNVINDVGLTALVATAFLENTHYVDRYENVVNKALEYIEQKFDDVKGDSYTLAISAYALAFKRTEAAERFLDELQATSVKTASYQYWKISIGSGLQKSKMVETSAYVILAYEKLDRSIKSVPALNWLQTQRNREGGAYSTKDTVIAIQALSTMAKYYHASKFDMTLNFTGDFKQNVVVKSDKFNIAHPPETFTIQTQDGVSVNAEGEGVAYVQIHKSYLLKPETSIDTFNITVKASGIESQMNLRVCVEPLVEQSQPLVEVSLPSGFEFDDSSRDQIIASGAKYVNTRNGRNVVDIFFTSMAMTRKCFDISATTFFSVGTQLPYSVKVYDYNDKDRLSAEYYLSTLGSKCPK